MNMKKFIALALTALVSVCSIFAQSFVVKSVKGTVMYEAEPGVMKKVVVGQELLLSANVDVKLGSELILELDGVEYKIGAMKKNTLDKLVSITPTKGLKSGGNVAKSVSGDTDAGNSVSTASSRAADVKDDMDWAD